MSDFGQAAALGVTQAVTDICKDLVRSTTNAIKFNTDKLVAEFEFGLGKYLERNHERCSKVKTLLHRFEPVQLEQVYVPPKLQFASDLTWLF